jgi:hypothetical protein
LYQPGGGTVLVTAISVTAGRLAPVTAGPQDQPKRGKEFGIIRCKAEAEPKEGRCLVRSAVEKIHRSERLQGSRTAGGEINGLTRRISRGRQGGRFLLIRRAGKQPNGIQEDQARKSQDFG